MSELQNIESFIRGRTDSELRTIKLADAEALDRLAESPDYGGLVAVYREYRQLVLAEMVRRPYVSDLPGRV